MNKTVTSVTESDMGRRVPAGNNMTHYDSKMNVCFALKSQCQLRGSVFSRDAHNKAEIKRESCSLQACQFFCIFQENFNYFSCQNLGLKFLSLVSQLLIQIHQLEFLPSKLKYGSVLAVEGRGQAIASQSWGNYSPAVCNRQANKHGCIIP